MTLSSSVWDTDTEFARKVRSNQDRLRSALRSEYDFVVCGAGTSGSVIARRLAENPSIHVLLIEAGGDDNVPSVVDPTAWSANIGTDRDWGYISEPEPALGGRRLHMAMGKVLGGGSGINAMAWSRGHARDWDLFADESGDKSWSYQSVLNIYRRIEDWRGDPDPEYRGTGGEVVVRPAPDPHPVALAMLQGAKEIGLPHYDNANGAMMEADRGVAIGDLRVQDGQRLSAFRSYTYPYMDRPNLTVLSDALVTCVIVDGHRAIGVEIAYRGQLLEITTAAEVGAPRSRRRRAPRRTRSASVCRHRSAWGGPLGREVLPVPCSPALWGPQATPSLRCGHAGPASLLDFGPEVQRPGRRDVRCQQAMARAHSAHRRDD
jgi:choline dehydrogenase